MLSPELQKYPQSFRHEAFEVELQTHQASSKDFSSRKTAFRRLYWKEKMAEFTWAYFRSIFEETNPNETTFSSAESVSFYNLFLTSFDLGQHLSFVCKSTSMFLHFF